MNKREAQKLSDEIVTLVFKESEKLNITSYKIGKDTGLSKDSIGNIKKFKQKPTLFTLMIIADYLQVDLGKIISEVMDKSR